MEREGELRAGGALGRGERLQSPPGLAQNELRADGAAGRAGTETSFAPMGAGGRAGTETSFAPTGADCEISLIGGDK